jgi:hypothetical protein
MFCDRISRERHQARGLVGFDLLAVPVAGRADLDAWATQLDELDV